MDIPQSKLPEIHLNKKKSKHTSWNLETTNRSRTTDDQNRLIRSMIEIPIKKVNSSDKVILKPQNNAHVQKRDIQENVNKSKGFWISLHPEPNRKIRTSLDELTNHNFHHHETC